MSLMVVVLVVLAVLMMIDEPNRNRWIRGGLQDVPDGDSDSDSDNDNDNDNEISGSSSSSGGSWGLKPDAIDDLITNRRDAIDEFESILAELFPQFIFMRLPEAVYGSTVSSITANAPVAEDDEMTYGYHIDVDPMQTPPSPWTDVYSWYRNRSPGKPRFVSCIIYLNDAWEGEWGAPTKFRDPSTKRSCSVDPRPGRCVILDQDLQHTVVPPTPNCCAGAKNRPRYSLVWKLILHPKTSNQDMTNLEYEQSKDSNSKHRERSKPILFGSAADPADCPAARLTRRNRKSVLQ